MLTKNGIELDLKSSNFKYKLFNYVFYFSSEFYLNNFRNNVKLFYEIEEIKLRNKYRIPIELRLYLVFSYYKKIEKRGFYVVNEKTKEVIPENISFKNLILN